MIREILELSKRRGEPVWIFQTPNSSKLLIASWAPENIKELSGRDPKSLTEDELSVLKDWLLSLHDLSPLAPDEELAETTKTGKPAVWEAGGGFTKTGWATVWCGPSGEPLRPLFVRRKGERACQEHALLPVREGMFKISASRNGWVEILKVVGFRRGYLQNPAREDWAVKLCPVYQGPADGAPEFLAEAVKASVEKASCYHCRTPHYVAGG